MLLTRNLIQHLFVEILRCWPLSQNQRYYVQWFLETNKRPSGISLTIPPNRRPKYTLPSEFTEKYPKTAEFFTAW